MEILGWNKDNPGDRLLELFKNGDLMGIETESKILYSKGYVSILHGL